MDMTQIKNQPKDKVVIITTGSQGEPMSALHRMAYGEHRQIEIGPGDKVILSASAIPGNEKTIYGVVDELFRRGAEVVYERKEGLHASGHACREELKLMQALVKPKFFVPVHGEFRHLKIHAELAKQMGVKANHIIISDIGKVIEMGGKSIKVTGTVPAGRVFVDGTGVGDVGNVVLRDRKHLAQDGMVVVVAAVSGNDGTLVTEPDIITRGFVYVKESEELITELKFVAAEAIEECARRNINDWANMKNTVKSRISDCLYKKTKRSPMVLPVITEV